MAVYDCFPFFDENDLLELRLNQHWDYFDKFIIVEASETHTGLAKPFNFDHERFKKYESKIIYKRIESFDKEIKQFGPELLDQYSMHDRSHSGQYNDDWIRDHFQGNYPIKILKDMGAKDDDVIYLSALDEILRGDAIKKGLEVFSNSSGPLPYYQLLMGPATPVEVTQQSGEPIFCRPSFGFNLDMYVYKFNLFCKNISSGPMTQFSLLKKILPATIRSLGIHTHPNIEDAGWHFTFFDDTEGEKVLQKQKSWAHSRDMIPGQKVKFEHTSVPEAIERMYLDYETKKVEISEDTHPKYLIENLDKYRNYIA